MFAGQPMRNRMLDEVGTDVALGEELGEELGAMLERAAVSGLGETAWLQVTGEDRVRWLNGMVTNSIQAMTPGEGSYSFLLNAQGRIQGEVTAFAEPAGEPSGTSDRLLLQVDRGELERLREWLDRYIIMDDVELGPAEELQAGVLVVGPSAEEVLRRVGLASLPGAEMRMVRADWRGTEVRVVRGWGPLAPRFEVWADAGTVRTIEQATVEAGAVRGGEAAVEALRVLEGRPRYGVDIRDRELPQETGQTRALHFSKGCYLGQEIVERIRSRGAVHRGFMGFVLEGDLPGAGAVELMAAGKAVGELTSVVRLPGVDGGRRLLGLGYVRREAVERGAELRYAGGLARVEVVPFRGEAASLASGSGALGAPAASER